MSLCRRLIDGIVSLRFAFEAGELPVLPVLTDFPGLTEFHHHAHESLIPPGIPMAN